MIDHQHLKKVGDIGATGVTGIVWLSQYAQLLMPNATLVLTFLGSIYGYCDGAGGVFACLGYEDNL